jgi:dihydroxy-acid dehydratase
MEAKSNLKNRLPSRHMGRHPGRHMAERENTAAGATASSGCTNADLCPPAIADGCRIRLDMFYVTKVFKGTRCIADLKLGGRFVAKDSVDASIITLPMKTLHDIGFLCGACMTVTGCGMVGNLHGVAWDPDDAWSVEFDGPLTARSGIADAGFMHDDDTGDVAGIDAERGSLDMQLSDSGLEDCRAAWQPCGSASGSGYPSKFSCQVGSARHGAVTRGSAQKACYADI